MRVDVTPELEVADGTAEPRSWQVITTAGVLSVEGPLGTAELSTVLAALTASRTA